MSQTYAQLLRENYDRYFLRKPNTRYWLVVVDDHFNDTNNFFLYHQKLKTNLRHANELLILPKKTQQYEQILGALMHFSKLEIEYRNTKQLVEPEKLTEDDPVHGHGN